jgi:hypothetical protein
MNTRMHTAPNCAPQIEMVRAHVTCTPTRDFPPKCDGTLTPDPLWSALHVLRCALEPLIVY